MTNLRHTKLFLMLVTVLIAPAPWARAEDNPPITLRNDLSDTIDLYIASEKSQSDSPWHHFQLDAGQSRAVTLSAPDRYFVVLQIGNERSRSKPLELRKFVAEHPNYVMRVSEIADTTIGASADSMASQKPAKIGVSVAPDPNASTPSGTWASLPVDFERYDANDQNIWTLSSDSVTLKLHNDLDNAVKVSIASKKSERANPWTELEIEANGDQSLILKSPDPFIIRVDVGNESARSKPVELKAFLAKHRDYVLNVGKGYQQMIAGGPMGGSGDNEEEKPPRPTLTVRPDPQRQQTPTQPEFNPDPMQRLGGGSNEQGFGADSGRLNIDWEN